MVRIALDFDAFACVSGISTGISNLSICAGMINIIADVSFGLHKRSLEKHETKKKNIYVKLQTRGLFRFFFQTPIGSKLRKKKRREAEFLKPP